MATAFNTADLCDYASDSNDASELAIVEPGFRSYGLHNAFCGPIATVKVHEDNVLVKDALASAGMGRVLVVDGGGSMRCALVGDLLAQMAIDNDWQGIVVFGCIRDSETINQMEIGIKALDTHPAKSVKRGAGSQGETVQFCGVSFVPGDYLYSDNDGIIVCKYNLLA